MKKRILALMLASAMVFSMAACGGGSTSGDKKETDSAPESTGAATEIPAGESVSQDADIVAAVNVDFTTLDPLDTSDTLSGDVQRMLYDGLFGFDKDMNIVPMLATEYEANDDATEYVFKLRQGVSFSDGTPWNADAAKANFDRWADKDLGLKRTTFLCNTLKSCEVVD